MLIQYGGINILTDPHLAQRASPLSFAWPKRFTPPGLSVADLHKIDLIIIFHNHYDQLDRITLEKLYEGQPNSTPHLFDPPKLKKWFLELGIKNVTELDWNESIKFCEWLIHAVPVQNWSSRTP